jgi:GNAT superfamily N-acetyltransferase
MQLTFEHIYNSGIVIERNDVFEHRHDAGILSRYDSNFIQFLEMPTLLQLQQAEQYLKAFHEARGQHFLKFKFPANEVPPKALVDYLKKYTVGYLELYAIDPMQFQAVSTEAEVKFVDDDDLAEFLQMQYNEDIHFGAQYAAEKQGFLLRQRQKPGHHQLLAYKNGQPVGSVELIETDKTIEIDNFYVLATKRGQGIGAAIQQFIMQYAEEKVVILVADGQDTVRDMYKKQGYCYYGFQYEALLVNEG